MSDLLPTETRPLVRAIAETMTDRVGAVPVPLPDALRPETAPDALLPYLAWEWSVDLWWTDMGPDEQRAAVLDAVFLHRLKGTLGGIKAHVERAGGTVVAAVTPPEGFFLTGSPDDDRRRYRRWLDTLPEIRLYTLREGAPAANLPTFLGAGDEVGDVAASFLGDEASDEPTFFAGAAVPGEIATLVRRDGEEIPISHWRLPDPRWGRDGEVIAFGWPGKAGGGLFCDDAASADGGLDGVPGGLDHLTVKLVASERDDWNLVAPVTRIQDVQPLVQSTYVEDLVGCYGDDAWAGQFLDELDPPRATWISLRLVDGADRGWSAGSFLDHDLMSLPPYTAWLTVDVPLPPEPAVLFADGGWCDGSAAGRLGPIEPVDRVLDAVAASKALRDQVLVSFDLPTRRSLSVRRFADLDLT